MPSTKTKKKSLKKSNLELNIIHDLLKAGELDDLLADYQERPVEFLRKFGKRFPPKLRVVIEDVYFGEVRRALLKANRGGGKSQLLSAIASVLYIFQWFDVLMLGGSAAQSQNDYKYTSEITTGDDTVETFSETVYKTVSTSKKGNWIRCLAASGKQVRGPHAGDPHPRMGNIEHGGALLIDEECEADEEIVRSALPTVNAADPAIIIRASTFHKAIGTFADAIDKAADLGYTIYEWDCFDVCRPCKDRCEECFVQFAGELHPEWPEYITKSPGFKPYCVGRAQTASDGLGWMRISEIKQFFREQSQDDFEIEMLGWRPSGTGLVLNPNDIAACLVDDVPFMPGMPGCITIDWGMMGVAAVEALQEQEDHNIGFLESDDYHLAPDQVIYNRCVVIRELYGFNEVYADSSHPYQNFNLQNNYGFQVTPVAFNQYKDLGAGWIKGLTEKKRMKIPRRFKNLIDQLKGWRKKDGKILKKNDHHPDSTLCASVKWAEQVPVNIEGKGTGTAREYTKAQGF